jgi:hypothetical protein
MECRHRPHDFALLFLSWDRAELNLSFDTFDTTKAEELQVLVQPAVGYELIVGSTRLGNLLGLLDREEMPQIKKAFGMAGIGHGTTLPFLCRATLAEGNRVTVNSPCRMSPHWAFGA